MATNAVIDLPRPDSLNDPLCLRIEGWLHGGERDADVVAVEIHANHRLLGETSLRLPRSDLEKILRLAPGTPTGFALFVSGPALLGSPTVRLECRARFADGHTEPGGACEVKLIAHDHRENHYGVLARPDETRLFHRADIYCTGPSVAEANPECLALVQGHLGPPPVRVLDVGCGFGGYGRALLAAGYDWFGVEVKASDCVELARLGLPHQQVDGRTLPFADGAFDSAICIEVLEHIADPAAFLAEVRRVTRRRLIVSVPNVELIPYLHRYMAVPWHLLEGDHKNFFTRASLRHLLTGLFKHVEVLCYARHPLSTPEGLPLYYHLLAVAEV